MNRTAALISVLASIGCLVGMIHWLGKDGKTAGFFAFLFLACLWTAYEIMADYSKNERKYK